MSNIYYRFIKSLISQTSNATPRIHQPLARDIRQGHAVEHPGLCGIHYWSGPPCSSSQLLACRVVRAVGQAQGKAGDAAPQWPLFLVEQGQEYERDRLGGRIATTHDNNNTVLWVIVRSSSFLDYGIILYLSLTRHFGSLLSNATADAVALIRCNKPPSLSSVPLSLSAPPSRARAGLELGFVCLECAS